MKICPCDKLRDKHFERILKKKTSSACYFLLFFLIIHSSISYKVYFSYQTSALEKTIILSLRCRHILLISDACSYFEKCLLFLLQCTSDYSVLRENKRKDWANHIGETTRELPRRSKKVTCVPPRSLKWKQKQIYVSVVFCVFVSWVNWISGNQRSLWKITFSCQSNATSRK